MGGIKTVIFDFDGTLVDNFHIAMEIAYSVTGIPRVSDSEVEAYRLLTIPQIMRKIKIPVYRLPRLVVQMRNMAQTHMQDMYPVAGIPEALAQLHDAGVQLLVISSNSERNVRSFLRLRNLEQYFDGVYGGVGLFDKSASLRKVMKRYALKRENCLYVGDELRDIAGAKRASVRVAAVTWGYQAPEALKARKPFALINHPSELVALAQADTV